MDRKHSVNQIEADRADRDKVIPWAEGNGLWLTINQIASDLTGVDVITFFVQNPYTCDSAESVAIRIGRQAAQVKPVLEGLSQAGLLRATDLGDVVVYELIEVPQRRQTLQQYVSWLQEGYHWARMVIDP